MKTKENFKPSDFKYEPIEQPKQAYWPSQIEGPTNGYSARVDTLTAVVMIMLLTAAIVAYLNH